ncbi:MAG: SMC family ATPase [Nanoarchaeota archaeon]|nr:SMC family ATPase [Nanoarchaeota archaeon]
MFISSITLDNIRSYTHQQITFEEGINVLYGNIGSGKSTILLAIEVALFGLKKSEGQHILRKGTSEGKISLTFTQEGEEFTILREFKKTKTGITQSAGSIILNSQIQEFSTQEMNMHIFNYFNFPISFLNKDKTLMYRFTHYTPQEQLKEILLTQADKRLEVLRKVFNIDKYKQLQQALQLTSKATSKELIVLETKLEELPKNLEEEISKKIKKIEELKTQFEQYKLKETSLKLKLDTILKNKRVLEDKRATIIEQVKQIQTIEKNILSCDEDLITQKTFQKQLQQKIEELDGQKNTTKDMCLKKEQLEKHIQTNEEKVIQIQKDSKKIEEQLLAIEREEFTFEKFKSELKKVNDLEMRYTQIESIIKDNELLIKKQDSNSKKEEKITIELQSINDALYTFDVSLSQKKSSLLELKEQIKLLDNSVTTTSNSSSSPINTSTKMTCPTCFQEIDKSHLNHLKDSIQIKELEITALEKDEKQLKLLETKKEVESKLKLLEISNNQLLKVQVQIETYNQQLQEISNQLNSQKEYFNTMYSNKDELQVFKEKLLIESNQNELDTTSSKNSKLIQLKQQETIFQQQLKDLQNTINRYREELVQINQLDKKLQELELQIVRITSKLEESISKEDSINKSKTQMQQNLKELSSQISLNSKINEKISEQQELEKKCNSKLEELFSYKSKCSISKEYEIKEKESLEYQLTKSRELKDKIQLLQLQNSFVKEDLIEICRIVEETLFIEIHTELSRKIVHYFKQLIDEQEIEVYIREDFSIIIEQNGYEVEVEQLSGGEKSALALSYRLSLKEVIEAHFRDENSLEYIILDEPTDGFSQNQIQKFAQILRQSNFRQIFLVSHDSNLLTSGEHIYTIEKENHISSIIKE